MVRPPEKGFSEKKKHKTKLCIPHYENLTEVQTIQKHSSQGGNCKFIARSLCFRIVLINLCKCD